MLFKDDKNNEHVLNAVRMVQGYKSGNITCGHYGTFRNCMECRTEHDACIDIIAEAYCGDDVR